MARHRLLSRSRSNPDGRPPPARPRGWRRAAAAAAALLAATAVVAGLVIVGASTSEPKPTATVVATSTSMTEASTSGSPTGAVPSYRATAIAPMSADIAEFVDFLTSHPNDIVELDVMVTLASLDDYLRVDVDDRTTWHLALYDHCFNPLDPSEPPNALDCGGYSLVFLNESVGTSGVDLHRGAMYRIFGYFSVGPLAGPNQGIFSIPLDPISPADALG